MICALCYYAAVTTVDYVRHLGHSFILYLDGSEEYSILRKIRGIALHSNYVFDHHRTSVPLS